MGLCGDFGGLIGDAACDHPMEIRDGSSCTCASCGVVCRGRFSACESVWGRKTGSTFHGVEPKGRAGNGSRATLAPSFRRSPADTPDAAHRDDVTDVVGRRLNQMQQTLTEHASRNAALVEAIERVEGRLEVLAASVAALRTAPGAARGTEETKSEPEPEGPRLYAARGGTLLRGWSERPGPGSEGASPAPGWDGPRLVRP